MHTGTFRNTQISTFTQTSTKTHKLAHFVAHGLLHGKVCIYHFDKMGVFVQLLKACNEVLKCY